MKPNYKKLVGTFTAAVMCATMFSALPASAASVGDVLRVGNGNGTQHKDNCDGYSYEIWLDNTGGSGSMTLGKGATFKAEWDASVSRGNFLARRGLAFDSSKKATSYDYIGMDYEANYKQTNSASGNSRLCVYGWFQNKGAAGNPPLVEYYIIEDWVDWCPDAQGKIVTIDGAKYKIFQMDHTGPSINNGSETFKQYFSVRQEKRTSGHITVSDHFKAWADQGWGIGNLYEVALNAEGWQSSGVADVTKLDVYTDASKAPGGGGGSVTTEPTEPPKPVEPDANGHYFEHTFASGSEGWSGRGAASVKASGGALNCSGRTDSWNGAALSLDSKTFIPGNTYAFSVDATQNSSSSESFKLTLECSVDGEKQYLNVAKGTCAKGETVQLVNNSYTIPAGATDLLLYVETEDTTTDFTIDNAIGGIEGSIKASSSSNPTNPTNPPASSSGTRGDLNGDKRIDAYDLALARAELVKGMTGKTTKAEADIDGNGTLNTNDLVILSNFLLGKINKFPEPAVTTTKAPETTKAPDTTTKPANVSSGNVMAECKASFTKNVPSNVKAGNTGKTTKIQYQSKVAGATKSANVWTPAGYDSSKKYNVLYMNHGVFGDESSMLTGFSVTEMASNMIASGEVDPFIIVFPQMYSGPGGGSPGFGITMEVMDNYDKFLQDMTESLMPYIEKNYSVYTGKEHTAIAGFSMGGRESLYLTISRPDLFGYCCASSPAPGIVPASDSFLSNHLGSYKANGQRMTNADFKIDKADMPYLLMIGGGTADGVVGTFPKEYHELFTQNGTDHIWQEFSGGGHDASVGTPMFYNFFKYMFKT